MLRWSRYSCGNTENTQNWGQTFPVHSSSSSTQCFYPAWLSPSLRTMGAVFLDCDLSDHVNCRNVNCLWDVVLGSNCMWPWQNGCRNFFFVQFWLLLHRSLSLLLLSQLVTLSHLSFSSLLLLLITIFLIGSWPGFNNQERTSSTLQLFGFLTTLLWTSAQTNLIDRPGSHLNTTVLICRFNYTALL